MTDQAALISAEASYKYKKTAEALHEGMMHALEAARDTQDIATVRGILRKTLDLPAARIRVRMRNKDFYLCSPHGMLTDFKPSGLWVPERFVQMKVAMLRATKRVDHFEVFVEPINL